MGGGHHLVLNMEAPGLDGCHCKSSTMAAPGWMVCHASLPLLAVMGGGHHLVTIIGSSDGWWKSDVHWKQSCIIGSSDGLWSLVTIIGSSGGCLT